MRPFPLTRRFLPETIIGLLIIAATLAVYIQVIDFGLVLRDDIGHYAHFIAQAGSREGLRTIITTPELFPYWVPVTFLSHFLDALLFGDNPGLHHLTNVFFHSVSSLLLFIIFRTMTGKLWQSALVAALFALHPLNVASVVWLGNRSSMVSTAIGLLLILAYLYYLKQKNLQRYLLILALFVLGLLSRPSIIWLPPLLLLLDFWPLKRWRWGKEPAVNKGAEEESNTFVLLEKMPLFIIGGLWLLFSMYFLKTTPVYHALEGQQAGPLVLLNSFVSYIAYPWKFFFPAGLPVYYPHGYPLQLLPAGMIATAFLIFCGVTLYAFKTRKQHPWFLFGWVWYLIGITPYIPTCVTLPSIIIERYAYIPLTGIFIIFSWGGGHLVKKMKLRKEIVAALTIAILIVFSAVSRHQAKNWADSVSFFRHAVEMRPGCSQTRINFGEVLFNSGQTQEAISQFNIASGLDPLHHVTHNHLGLAYAMTGKTEIALRHYRRALEIKPDYVEALNNLANLLVDIGGTEEAIQYYRQSLNINPLLFRAHNNLATALIKTGDYDEAVFHFNQALTINPEYETAWMNLEILLSNMNNQN